VHWTGGRWRTVASLPVVLRNSALGAVLARSDQDVWVGGAIRNGPTDTVGHWNGRRWTVTRLRAAATAARFRLTSMAPDGSGGIWALAVCISARCVGTGTIFRLWHEVGGRWTGPVVPSLTGARQAVLIHLATAGRSVWASGIVAAKSGNSDGLIALWGPVP
jgi:hypothetical protein